MSSTSISKKEKKKSTPHFLLLGFLKRKSIKNLNISKGVENHKAKEPYHSSSPPPPTPNPPLILLGGPKNFRPK